MTILGNILPKLEGRVDRLANLLGQLTDVVKVLNSEVADLKFRYIALEEEHTHVVNELYALRTHRHKEGMWGATTAPVGPYSAPQVYEPDAPAPAEGGHAGIDPDHPAWRG